MRLLLARVLFEHLYDIAPRLEVRGNAFIAFHGARPGVIGREGERGIAVIANQQLAQELGAALGVLFGEICVYPQIRSRPRHKLHEPYRAFYGDGVLPEIRFGSRYAADEFRFEALLARRAPQ